MQSLVFWFGRPSCTAPTCLAFFLRLSLSLSLAVFFSLLAPLYFVVTFQPCRHTPPHSIKSHRQHSLSLLPSFLSLLSFLFMPLR